MRISRRHVQHAVISTPFDAQSEFEIVQRFTTAYYDRYGEVADAFSSLGFDAATLVIRVMQSKE